MNEAAPTEGASLKSSEGIRSEGHLQETRSPSAVETANIRINDDIKNGASLEHIEKQLESELQTPEAQQQLINEFSPYSKEINSQIGTTKELSVYTENGLKESAVLERRCLQMEIDPNRTDAMGRSNTERAERGLAPLDENGDSINLHHIGQKASSPLAELPDRVHKECDSVLHDKTIVSEVHGEGSSWNEERAAYWRERSQTL